MPSPVERGWIARPRLRRAMLIREVTSIVTSPTERSCPSLALKWATQRWELQYRSAASDGSMDATFKFD